MIQLKVLKLQLLNYTTASSPYNRPKATAGHARGPQPQVKRPATAQPQPVKQPNFGTQQRGQNVENKLKIINLICLFRGLKGWESALKVPFWLIRM